MAALKTVRQACEELGIDWRELARRSGLEEKRVRAILEGRWTASPQERALIAQVFGLDKSEIAWDNQVPVAHLYGHGPQFGRTP